MNKKRKFKPVDFQEHLARELKDPEFKRQYDEFGKQLEVAIQINKLRKKHRLSQQQLAHKLKTTQSNVARIEAGNQNLTLTMLDKIATVFGRKLKIEFTR